jgi:ABC-type antimicrobial peptide transport system permease subunit
MKKVLLAIVTIALLVAGIVLFQNMGEEQIAKKSEKIHTFNRESSQIVDDDTPEAIENIGLDILKTVYQNIYIETKKIPNCLKEASSKQEAFACSDSIQELNKELSRAMGDTDHNNFTMNINDFIWDEKNKHSMIKEIEKGLDAMKETSRCIKEIEVIEEISECLQEKNNLN